jgi:hypothetical protein
MSPEDKDNQENESGFEDVSGTLPATVVAW